MHAIIPLRHHAQPGVREVNTQYVCFSKLGIYSQQKDGRMKTANRKQCQSFFFCRRPPQIQTALHIRTNLAACLPPKIQTYNLGVEFGQPCDLLKQFSRYTRRQHSCTEMKSLFGFEAYFCPCVATHAATQDVALAFNYKFRGAKQVPGMFFAPSKCSAFSRRTHGDRSMLAWLHVSCSVRGGDYCAAF